MMLRINSHFGRSDSIEDLGDRFNFNRLHPTTKLTLSDGTFGVHTEVLMILKSFNYLISIIQLSEIDTVINIPMGSQ